MGFAKIGLCGGITVAPNIVNGGGKEINLKVRTNDVLLVDRGLSWVVRCFVWVSMATAAELDSTGGAWFFLAINLALVPNWYDLFKKIKLEVNVMRKSKIKVLSYFS
ncbi:hypothetical protein ACFX13_047007 [Malus domestica]